MRRLTLSLLLLGLTGQAGRAEDWPTYAANPSRTGYTSQELPAQLTLRWVYQGAPAPVPAWPVSNRLPYDRAHQAVIAGGALYFGSSADGKVYALDAASGAERWTFYTGGPVRFAPAAWQDRVFAVSDDGHLYCLAAADGKLLWKKRGGPDDRLLLGNDRLVSRWPARGGPMVVDGVVYFAAGIWPSEGILLYALDAATGKVLWVNGDSGSIYMPQPHGGANADSGVAAQGYLVARGDQLFVPTGRAVPAAFERGTGKFQYFRLQDNGHKGGTSTLAAAHAVVNAGTTYDSKNGQALDTLGPGEAAEFPDGLARSSPKEVVAYRWADKTKKLRKGGAIQYKGLEKLWSVPVASGGAAVVVAGPAVVSGGAKKVVMIDRASQRVAWSADLDGTAYGLAVADGRLYVSTDLGTIYCFDGTGAAKPVVHQRPAPDVKESAVYAAAAEEIVRQTGVTDGYCVDLNCGDASLAIELAKRTRLQIYALDSDPEAVARARKRLDAAGLYGVRVTVHQGDPAKTPYPRYFADLVVSGRSVTEGVAVVPAVEEARVQRPYGGVVCVGKPGAMQKAVRGPLDGAGSWTHQYADAANRCCSTDTLVKGPLSMLWWRDSDFEMPSRHGRGPAPLFYEGRLFVEGTDGVCAVDAYNGRRLWDHPLPNVLKAYHGEHLMGTAGTQSNLCVSADGLYVRTGNRCLRLDLVTGKKLAEFEAPRRPDGQAAPWGYITCEDGTLFGSLADTRHIVRFTYGKADMSQLLTESVALFALDARTGRPKWTYAARHSLRHNAIAVGGGRVYLIDRPAAETDKIGGVRGQEHPKGELLALDAVTGQVLWRSADNIYGTLLALSVEHGTLLMGYQPTRFKLPSEVGGQLSAFRASDGQRLWDRKASYVTRPLINGRTVYAQGGGWDLVTGEERPFAFKRSYGCGQFAGCTNLMVFRSATLGYYDLERQKGTIDYGGIRPGCWINAIPAGGLVLVPDASSGCQCSYLNQAWIALQPPE